MYKVEIISEADLLIKMLSSISQVFANAKIESIPDFFDDWVLNYEKNLKRNELYTALIEISNDEYIDNSFGDWKENLFNRFAYFSLAKTYCDSINKRFEYKNGEYSNTLIVEFTFIKQIWEFLKKGLSNYNSFTANSSNHKIAKPTKIDFPEKLIEPHMSSVEIFEKNVNSHIESQKRSHTNLEKLYKDLGLSEIPTKNDLDEETAKKEYLDFQEMLLNCDINVIEKKIFNGILNDFAITKTIKGKQSEGYKVKLLWKLFIHSHSYLYHEKSPQFDKSKDELNRINLLKLIQ